MAEACRGVALATLPGWNGPGGPKASKLWPLLNQASPSARAMIRALPSDGTRVKSKVSRVLPGGNRASARWRWMLCAGLWGPRNPTALLALGELHLGEGSKQPGGGPALPVGACAEIGVGSCAEVGPQKSGQSRAMVGRRRAVSSVGSLAVSTVMVMQRLPVRRSGRRSLPRQAS
jgi:hypothetical protein